MRVTSGKVVDGRIEVEGEPLPEGAEVTVVVGEADGTFEVDDELKAELLLSIAEAERGELIPAEEVMRKFRHGD